MESIHDVLLTMGVQTRGEWDKEYEMLKKKVPISKEEVDLAYGKLSCRVLTFTDAAYPEELKNIWHPPLVLFYYGNIDLLQEPRLLAVVGSREASEYGLTMAEKLVSDSLQMDKSLVIVSGMAKGIDAKAQRTAMSKNAGIIAVLGSGIDNPYPPENKDIYEYCKAGKGLVIGEYPLDVAPDKDHFPFRNRLIAGLCKTLLVVEAKIKSGTAITIRHAIEDGKEVLVVPQPVNENDLTGELLREGAGVCLSAIDIIKSFS